MEAKCKKCTYWKSEQAELDYSTFCGICITPKNRYTTSGDGQATVLDRSIVNRANPAKPIRYFETLIGEGVQIEHSNYCLVTDENYGCVHFRAKDIKNGNKEKVNP